MIVMESTPLLMPRPCSLCVSRAFRRKRNWCRWAEIWLHGWGQRC